MNNCEYPLDDHLGNNSAMNERAGTVLQETIKKASSLERWKANCIEAVLALGQSL